MPSKWWVSLLAGFFCIVWALWVRRDFRDPDDETTPTDEWRGFMFRLFWPLALGVGVLLVLSGVSLLLVSLTD